MRPMSVRVVHQSGVPLTSLKIKTRWLPPERPASRQFGSVSPRNQHTTNCDTTRDGGDGGRRRAFLPVVDPALKANGVEPRQKTQHRMRIATPESQRERQDHWARSAQKRRKQRERNDDFFEHAR